MFRNRIIAIFIVIAGTVVFLSSAKPEVGETYQRALPKFKKSIVQDFDVFLKDAENFKQLLNKNQNKKALTQQEKEAYFALRHSFKMVESILEYVDKQNYDRSINGAPLPKIEPKAPDLNILQPKGLQVMDEIIYADDFNTESHQELYKLSENFYNGLAQYLAVLKKINLSERQLFEAYRYNIIRIASLSITGFDTPGSLTGLEDAKVELKAMHKNIVFFDEELAFTNNQSLLDTFNVLTQKGIQLLNDDSDFNTFNRAKFIREVLNPLYKNLKDIHLALAYETWDETESNFNQALNYKADNLFSKDFLNKFSYVSLEDDSLFVKRKKLGRILFYDPLLSGDNKMACVSCHDPKKAFTDGLPKSLAADAKSFLQRNSMTLPYSVYAQKMFLDMRAKGLENQFAHVVNSEQEFHTKYSEIVSKLRQSKKYTLLFYEAFPDYNNGITTNAIDYALAAYVMSLGDFDSKFDAFMRYENNDLSKDEEAGFNLFAGKAACATCHFVPVFNGLVPPFFKESESEVLGVTTTENQPWILDQDNGRKNAFVKENAKFYKHSFKTVTVRNIEKTAPYMHNGAFYTLESVLDFYNDGGGAGRGLDVPFQTLSEAPLELSDIEIQQIIAFMKTLTDKKEHKAPEASQLPRDFENVNWNNRQIPLE